MYKKIQRIGRATNQGVMRIGEASRFAVRLLFASFFAWRRPMLIVREMYNAGVLSLAIIAVSGLFVGLVLALQGYQTLLRFGSTEVLGVLVALALVTELGPVVSALLFSSRAGSSVTAEIGLMKATEQLQAMDLMAVDPMVRIVAPRFWAGVLSLPLLAAIFSAMGIIGGWLVGVIGIGIDQGAFWSQMQSNVHFFNDVSDGILKSMAFATAVSFIAVLKGYFSRPTAEGVSRAITGTVVSSAMTVLALDFVLTSFMFRG